MLKGETTTKLFCPSCGQKLSVPTVDLRQMLRCPRCQEVRPGAELVSTRTTVPAVPAEEYDALNVAAAPETVRDVQVPERVTLDDVPIPATVRMPGAPGAVLPAPAIGPQLPQAAPVAAWTPPPAVPYQVPAVAAVGAPAPWQPPAASVSESTEMAMARARALAIGGVAAVGVASDRILRASRWLDRRLDGHRHIFLSSASACVVFAPWLDAAQDRPSGVFTATSLAFFALALLVLALARVDAFRDDVVGWQLRLVGRTFLEILGALVDWKDRLFRAPAPQRLADLGPPLFFAGLFVAACERLLEAMWLELGGMTVVADIAMLLGLGFLVWGRLLLRRRAAAPNGLGITVAGAGAARTR